MSNAYHKLLNEAKARHAAKKRKQRLGLAGALTALLALSAGAHVKRIGNAHSLAGRKANWIKNLKPHPGGLVYNNGKWTNSTKVFTSGNNRPYLVRGNNVYSLKAGGFDPHAWTPTFKVGNKKMNF